MRCGRALVVLVAFVAAVAGVGAVPAAAAADSGQVRFAESSLQAVEGAQVRVVVERVDLPVSRLVVHYRTADVAGSAAAGPDYVQSSGALVFDVGVRSNTFTVWLRDDEVSEETEHLLLHLEVSSGTGASTRLTILDDDFDAAGAASDTPASASGPPASGVATAAPSAPAPVVVVSPARSSRAASVAAPRTRTRVSRPAAPRRIILQQTPSTPFELRPVPGSFDEAGGPTAVDPLLALAAGLLLARVAAEAWFRTRLATA